MQKNQISPLNALTQVCICIPPWPWLPAQHHWAYPAVHPRLSPVPGWPPPTTHEAREEENYIKTHDSSTPWQIVRADTHIHTPTHTHYCICFHGRLERTPHHLSILGPCVYVMWLSTNRPAEAFLSLHDVVHWLMNVHVWTLEGGAIPLPHMLYLTEKPEETQRKGK